MSLLAASLVVLFWQRSVGIRFFGAAIKSSSMSGLSCRSLIQELRGEGSDARKLECLHSLTATFDGSQRALERREKEETAALLLSSDLVGILTRVAFQKTRQAAVEIIGCLHAWRLLARGHVAAWETADFVEAIVRAFGLLVGDDVDGTNWEVCRAADHSPAALPCTTRTS